MKLLTLVAVALIGCSHSDPTILPNPLRQPRLYYLVDSEGTCFAASFGYFAAPPATTIPCSTVQTLLEGK